MFVVCFLGVHYSRGCSCASSPGDALQRTHGMGSYIQGGILGAEWDHAPAVGQCSLGWGMTAMGTLSPGRCWILIPFCVVEAVPQ